MARIRLDSRLKHAGMTVFEKEIRLTQQAAGELDPQRLNDIFYSCKTDRPKVDNPHCQRISNAGRVCFEVDFEPERKSPNVFR